ncbi:MAG TPA: AbrB/MazE/SpoVT family DNA-binding domain-containing protein [Vicinamibacteria bacterium]|jgi:AbrB family looped-hinge helix DNA binding protein
MATITISPKYRVVIPPEVCDSLGLRPGDKLQVFEFEGRIELIPVKDLKNMRGFLKGIDTAVPRDEDRS